MHPSPSELRPQSLDHQVGLGIVLVAAAVLMAVALVLGTADWALQATLAVTAVMIVAATWWHVDGASVRSPLFVLVPILLTSLFARTVTAAAGSTTSPEVTRVLTLGRPPAFFTAGAVALLVFTIAFCIGYGGRQWLRTSSAPRTYTSTTGRPVTEVTLRRSRSAMVLGAVLGLVAFVLFVQATGGLDLTRLSAKRTPFTFSARSYSSFGSIRTLNVLAQTLVAQHLYFALSSRAPLRPVVVRVGIASVLVVLLPLYASARTEVLWFLAWFLVVYLAAGRARRRSLLVGVTAVLALSMALNLTTLLRNAEDLSAELLVASVSPDTLTSSVVISQNLPDIFKTSHVIDAVPEVLPHANGATLGAWVLAPVPRSLWAAKPVIQAGPVIGHRIYGTRGSGVPPGVVAEMYWNFGAVGVLLGGALLGWSSRRLWRWAQNVFTRHRWDDFPLLVAFTPFLPLMWGNTVGSALFTCGSFLVCALAAVAVVRRGGGHATP